jgi:hypothetical protein
MIAVLWEGRDERHEITGQMAGKVLRIFIQQACSIVE